MAMYGLGGKVAVITGAGRRKGLGEAMARRLAAEGCNIVLSDIGTAKGPHFDAGNIGSAAEMDAIAGEINDAGGEAVALACDVRDEDDVAGLIGEAAARFGRLDVMVNNAGIAGPTAALEDISPEDWERTIAVNLNSMFYCARRAIPLLEEAAAAHGDASLINLASTAGRHGFAQRTPYSAPDWAGVRLTKARASQPGAIGRRGLDREHHHRHLAKTIVAHGGLAEHTIEGEAVERQEAGERRDLVAAHRHGGLEQRPAHLGQALVVLDQVFDGDLRLQALFGPFALSDVLARTTDARQLPGPVHALGAAPIDRP